MVDWLKHVDPKEDWILVLDSDMYLRKPFYPQFFNATPGWCISADYTYMIGAYAAPSGCSFFSTASPLPPVYMFAPVRPVERAAGATTCQCPV